MSNAQQPSMMDQVPAPKTKNQPVFIKVIANPNLEGPKVKNHSTIYYKNQIILFGGYDGKKNHNKVYTFDLATNTWEAPHAIGKEIDIPDGRNGHTATLIDDTMFIIGGWLGSSQQAERKVYSLDLLQYKWKLIMTHGNAPGPCNMHSADLAGRTIYIFRGGDGKDYLNDLHSFNVDTNTWEYVNATGSNPSPRANHSSAVIGNHLYIFGGWNGSVRLRDLYQLDFDTLIWKELTSEGEIPSPRAGMSLCGINNKLYLFGGSGPSASCYNDLLIFDPSTTKWQETKYNNKEVVKARAGHSMTVVEEKIYIIGGSFGQMYYQDFYSFDTNPAPEINVEEDLCKVKLQKSLRNYCNKQQFSDITFIVEGKPFYAHKIILSLLSERFESMFNSGMKESINKVIEIKGISFQVFSSICQYLYTGEVKLTMDSSGEESKVEKLLEFLTVSDEYLLDEVKRNCEKLLIKEINKENFSQITKQAYKYNASHLLSFCRWYHSKNKSLLKQHIPKGTNISRLFSRYFFDST